MMLAVLLLAAVATAAPPTQEKKQLVITNNFFPESLVLYTGQHDIIDIIIPLNQLNFPDETVSLEAAAAKTLFFVEADIDDKGGKDYKGIYVFKDVKATKVLDNGQCVTYSKKTKIYFGAKDGIYKYNDKDLTATKYGTVTESVIKMAIDTEHANLYYLTEDYVLYKYNVDEIESTKVEAVKDARDITFDFDGVMYFYDGKNHFYTYDGNKVTKVEDMPAKPTKVELIRVPIMVSQGLAVVDGKVFTMQADGSSEKTIVEFQVNPTAFGPELYLYQYYAYNKKLYGYNVVTLLEDKTIHELSEFFDDKEDQVNAVKSSKVSSRL